MIIAATCRSDGTVCSFLLGKSLVVYDYDILHSSFDTAVKQVYDTSALTDEKQRVELLKEKKVDVLLAGGITPSSRKALDDERIVYIPGVLRNVEEAVQILLSGGNPGASECGGACGSCDSGCESN